MSVVVVVIVVDVVKVTVELVWLLVAVKVLVGGSAVVSVSERVTVVVDTSVDVKKNVEVPRAHSSHVTQVAQLHIWAHVTPSSSAR